MKRLLLFAGLALLAAPALAHADTGYVVANVNLHAGPDIGYPLINVVPAGAPVYIDGCIQGYEWCDVVFQGQHGWVAGDYIQFDCQNRPVYLPSYGAAVGIPIIGFSIASYWNRWYVGRPFYRERDRWYRQPPPRHRPPPRPSHPGYRGGGHRSDHFGSPRGGHYAGPHQGQQHRWPQQNRPQQREPQQNRREQTGHHQLPREAMRPVAGPIHAVPHGRVEAPRPAEQRGEQHGSRGNEHGRAGGHDRGGDHGNDQGH